MVCGFLDGDCLGVELESNILVSTSLGCFSDVKSSRCLATCASLSGNEIVKKLIISFVNQNCVCYLCRIIFYNYNIWIF